MNRALAFLGLSGILLSISRLPGAERPATIDAALAPIAATRRFSEVAISPDGKRTAWVEAQEIFLQDIGAKGPARRVTACPGARCAERDVAWSRDGKSLAFLSEAGLRGQAEIYASAGGAPKRLTSLTGDLASPRWSPDGKSIAFLFIENAPRKAGPLAAMTPEYGVIESHVFEQRLAVVDVSTGRVRQLTPADLYVYEFDWSPDGKGFVATAAHGPGDANWYIAELYTVSAASGETKSIYKPPLQIAVPRWSPDGRNIAFIGGLMSDEGNIGGDVFVVPAEGGEARNLHPGLSASASSLEWLPDGEILFSEFVPDGSGISKLDLSSGKIESLWRGPETLWARAGASLNFSLAADGRTTAVIRQSLEHPPEVWAGPPGDWKQVTRANVRLKPTWGRVQSLEWTSDEFRIHGWLIFPRDYDPAKRYPLVVFVHGGPGWAVVPNWPDTFFNVSALSTAGYFVLMPNPRGSFGQGKAFARANVKDFGYGDLRDILKGVDEVENKFPVDPHREGITGWSYGGFMTMWAVTQTGRFRAAVAGAGLANWQSYWGENDIDQWMLPFFGATVYDDPAVYARSSPINYIKNAKTPTLVLVGERDGECPLPQSYEFWHALKTLGVETQLVVYPGEGHDISRPEHRRDIVVRTVDWFDRHMK